MKKKRITTFKIVQSVGQRLAYLFIRKENFIVMYCEVSEISYNIIIEYKNVSVKG